MIAIFKLTLFYCLLLLLWASFLRTTMARLLRTTALWVIAFIFFWFWNSWHQLITCWWWQQSSIFNVYNIFNSIKFQKNQKWNYIKRKITKSSRSTKMMSDIQCTSWYNTFMHKLVIHKMNSRSFSSCFRWWWSFTICGIFLFLCNWLLNRSQWKSWQWATTRHLFPNIFLLGIQVRIYFNAPSTILFFKNSNAQTRIQKKKQVFSNN